MYTNMKRPVMNQSLHDKMVRTRAINLVNEGYSVSADIADFPQPPTIKEHIPDIYAERGVSKIITEIETCDTIGSGHTREQYDAFSSVFGTEFHVKTPRSCISEAKVYARSWGIRVDQWWYEEGL
jgi:hypothetical protein